MDDTEIRAAIEAHFRAIGSDAVAAGAIYADDAVLEYVQSRELIRGKDGIMASRRAYPGRPSAFSIRRVAGHGDAWTAELILRFDGVDPHPVVAVLELRDGKVVREAIYIAEPWDAPAYRTPWAEVAPDDAGGPA